MRKLERRIQSPNYHLTKLQNKLYGEIKSYLKQEGMNQSKLAEKLGVTKGYISQIINDGADHKLSNLFKIALAIGKIPKIEFLDPEEFMQIEKESREDQTSLNIASSEEPNSKTYTKHHPISKKSELTYSETLINEKV